MRIQKMNKNKKIRKKTPFYITSLCDTQFIACTEIGLKLKKNYPATDPNTKSDNSSLTNLTDRTIRDLLLENLLSEKNRATLYIV